MIILLSSLIILHRFFVFSAFRLPQSELFVSLSFFSQAIYAVAFHCRPKTLVVGFACRLFQITGPPAIDQTWFPNERTAHGNNESVGKLHAVNGAVFEKFGHSILSFIDGFVKSLDIVDWLIS